MNHPNPASSRPWRALPSAGALARRPARRPAAPGPAAPTGMPPALPPAAVKRSRSLDHQFQPCSREASTMTMIGTRTHAADGAAVLRRARAGDRRTCQGDGNQAPNAVEVAASGAHPLTSPQGDTPGTSPGHRLGGGS